MRINDVIREAPTEATVYFLLTAYIESAWRTCGEHEIFPVVAKLPLAGIDDVEARFDALATQGVGRAGLNPVDDIINESIEVFGTAARRLRRLRHEQV
jgi:hypothetical protein